MNSRLFSFAALVLAVNLCVNTSAVTYLFSTTLLGPNEDPPNASPGSGTAWVTYDGTAQTLKVQVDFEDLIGVTTVAHIHAPTAVPGEGNIGVATYPGTFPGFPAGVTSGSYENTWDLTDLASYTANFINLHGGTAAGAEAGLLAAMLEGRAYVNVHTTVFPGGEIRGFLARVPDAGSTALLLGLSLLGMAHLKPRR